MSVVNKKPYIVEKLELFSTAELSALKVVLNSKETQFHLDLKNITPSEKGIRVGELKLNYGFIRGVLCYQDKYCFFISYESAKKLLIYDINPNAREFSKVKESLSISEFRSVIDDIGESKGSKEYKSLSADSVIAKDTIDFSSNSGDFGTKAKAKINALIHKHYSHRVHYSKNDVVLDLTLYNQVADEITSLSALVLNARELFDTNEYFTPIYCLSGGHYYQLLRVTISGSFITAKLVSYDSGVDDITLNAMGTFSDIVREI